MSSPREGIPSKLFFLGILSLLLFKGWLLSLVLEEPVPVCRAEAMPRPAAPAPSLEPSPEACSQEVEELAQKLRGEHDLLARRARQVEADEAKLKAYAAEVDERIRKLSALRTEVQAMFQRIQEHEDEKQQRLVKIYESMEPESAAQRIETLDEGTASWLLMKMSPRKAGQVLGLMSPAKTSQLTRLLSQNQLGKNQ
jgi:flagellar motility protein MotE (MotC chaperone)